MFEAELVDSVPAEAPAEAAPSPEPEATSPDGGNAAPESTEVDTPAAEATAPEATQPEESLYELPDGRKVDAATLQREWKENFMPDYTRKSQALAEKERVQQPLNNQTDVPAWKDPNYVPQSYAEIIELGKQAAIEELTARAHAEEQARTEVVAQIDSTVAAIKTKDPGLDENALFQHANKYGFTDLNTAYENYAELRKVAMDTEQRTLKNVNTRKVDPIAGGGTPTAPVGDALDYGQSGKYSGALEYLRSLKT